MVAQGKEVMEIRPGVDFHKGTAVRELLRGTGRDLLPIYPRDGSTDGPAFRQARNQGITVFIGSGWLSSEAEYCLESPAQAERFLQLGAETLQGSSSQSESAPAKDQTPFSPWSQP